MQFIHGPVALSKTLGRCLNLADKVFYLASTKDTLNHALRRAGYLDASINNRKYKTFVNALPEQGWPSPIDSSATGVFWAASLLKWKGLDLLMSALRSLPEPEADVCYIKPKSTILSLSKPDRSLENVFWHHSPENLDQIRKQRLVFVSTSKNEPFGLSILEAMAAGMCVVIPEDGSYWDQILVHGNNCYKYQPGCSESLAKALCLLLDDTSFALKIGNAGMQIAENYRGLEKYRNIHDAMFQAMSVDGEGQKAFSA